MPDAVLLDDSQSCPGLILARGVRGQRTAALCFGCSRYGRRCEKPLAPAAALVTPTYGASYWDCPNRRSSGGVFFSDPSPTTPTAALDVA